MTIQINWDAIPEAQRAEWRELVRTLNDLENKDVDFQQKLRLKDADDLSQMRQVQEDIKALFSRFPKNAITSGLVPQGHVHPPADAVSATHTLESHSDVATSTPTKGDLLVGSGTEWDDLPVGVDDYALTADASATLGVAWAPVVAYSIRKGLAIDRPETGLVGGEVWFSTDGGLAGEGQLFIRTDH